MTDLTETTLTHNGQRVTYGVYLLADGDPDSGAAAFIMMAYYAFGIEIAPIMARVLLNTSSHYTDRGKYRSYVYGTKPWRAPGDAWLSGQERDLLAVIGALTKRFPGALWSQKYVGNPKGGKDTVGPWLRLCTPDKPGLVELYRPTEEYPEFALCMGPVDGNRRGTSDLVFLDPYFGIVISPYRFPANGDTLAYSKHVSSHKRPSPYYHFIKAVFTFD